MMRSEPALRSTRSPQQRGDRPRPRALGRLALVAALALLLPASGAGALSSSPFTVEGGSTFALPLPDFFSQLDGVDVQLDGTLPFFFGLEIFPITGGHAQGADAFFPYTGVFEHAGTSIGFERGSSRVDFLDPVVDTETLSVLADVEIFENGSLVETRLAERVFNLTPVLPALPPGLGLGLGLELPSSLPAVVDLFGEQLLLDLVQASATFQTETILSEALFGEPLDLAGRSAAFLGIVAEVAPVPEPSTLLLALAGLAAAVGARRRLGRA